MRTRRGVRESEVGGYFGGTSDCFLSSPGLRLLSSFSRVSVIIGLSGGPIFWRIIALDSINKFKRFQIIIRRLT